MPALTSSIKVVPQTVSSPGTPIFTVANGPIRITYLGIEITTIIGATACTVQFVTTDAVASITQAISAASPNIQSQSAGVFVILDPQALATAPVITAQGGSHLGNPGSGTNTPIGGIVMNVGTCSLVTTGSPSGNIKYHLQFEDLSGNSVVTMA